MRARLASTSLRTPERPGGPRSRLFRIGAGLLVVVVAAALASPLRGDDTPSSPAPEAEFTAASTNRVTPGNFRGYGFDQCETQSQATMDAWLEHSPFLAVGVYISGASRFCRTQKLLTPTWVSTQLAKGWRILPITLGPQSTCVGRFPRYGANIDPTISNSSANGYLAARSQGSAEAVDAVSAAQRLGIVEGSTLYYDLEGWSDHTNATCRESALSFLTGWTRKVHDLGYVSGVYSSAGSGMRVLDDARAQGRTDVTMPDQIWIARWDGKANTSTSYLRSDGWLPGRRLKQYQGGHDETWGGVRINIDRNFLDLGTRSTGRATACGGVAIDLPTYRRIPVRAGTTRKPEVRALQCLLRSRGFLRPSTTISGNYNLATRAAVRDWRVRSGFTAGRAFNRRHWVAILAAGKSPVLKIGAQNGYVRRVQRAMQAAMPSLDITIDGIYDAQTARQVKAYRAEIGLPARPIVSADTWRLLHDGRF